MTMKYPAFVILLLLQYVCVRADVQPNILVIMADDLGFSDLRCYGSDIDTPNLDALARNGLRFTQFHNASRCCPTRAALLTGRYPHEVGLRSNGASLSRDVPTLAEILRDNGYHTGMTGKWHLTHAAALAGDGVNSAEHLAVLNNQTRVSQFGERATYPAARGFDRHFGVIWGIVNFFHPFALVDRFEPVYDLPRDFYLTDALNSRTADYIRDFAQDDKPFFIYLAHAAPHWPLHARAEDRAKYRGRYDSGWPTMRRQRYDRQVKMGLIDPAIYPLPDIDRGNRRAWKQLSEEQQRRDSAKMETHAAMIDRLDQGLGDVITALKQTGQFENTLIVFLADNGASPEEPVRPGYDRPSETPDGRTIRYTGKFPVNELGRDDTWTGLGPALSNACNTPFRFWKKESYHGGCASPFIVHWPARKVGHNADPSGDVRMTAEGRITDQVAHVVDLLPTFLDAAGVDAGSYASRGKNLLPVLQGRTRDGHDGLFFEHAGGAAHRAGDWKIVRLKPNRPWALYDLSRDRTETTDLAKRHPKRVQAMAAAWAVWWYEVTGEQLP
ncbi:MAG: arylsulfatase [Fuerstiella sp.]|nr:arylsulfatase [Fuerstiella sp.]